MDWLENIGWKIVHGPEIAPDTLTSERKDYSEVLLSHRLREALRRLNPALPPEALDDALRKLTRLEAPELIGRNRASHRYLVDGVTVAYRAAGGDIRGAQARLPLGVIEFKNAATEDATIWTTSSSERSHAAATCCDSRRSRRKAARTCASCCPCPRASSCSPRSTSPSRRKRATAIRSCLRDGTSS